MTIQTTTEAAAALGLTQGRIRQLCISGELKGEKKGRDWWIQEESIRRYKPRRQKRTGPRGPKEAEARFGWLGTG